MKHSAQFIGWKVLATYVVCGLLLVGNAVAQEPTSDAPAEAAAQQQAEQPSEAAPSDAGTEPAPPRDASGATESTATDAAIEDQPISEDASDTETSATTSGEAEVATGAEPPTDTTTPADPASTPPAADSQAAGEGDATPATGGSLGEDPADASADEAAETGMGALTIGLIIAALFIVPILLGNALAKALRMQDYGWKIALVLGVIAASLLIVTFGRFRFGPDLAGGITLIYELQDTSQLIADDQTGPDAEEGDRSREFKIEELINSLKERIDPTGTREVTIRPYGPAIEIIIPETGEDQLNYVKRRITDIGQLEFRITADPRFASDRPIIEKAKTNALNQKNVMIGDTKVAEWVAYNVDEFGPVDLDDGRLVKRMAGNTPEALVLMDPMNVTGDELSSTTMGVDERGGPAVNFTFNRIGAALFKRLTSENRPNPANPNVLRGLGIVLDKRLVSAPVIRETISDSGQISGRGMGQEEVEYIIQILNAGSLPAALNKTPISQEIISPTLGAVTIERGKVAIAASLIATFAFMLVYYRFAGLVACIVLSLNLLLVLAIMVLINAAFTLPGLAGLVLTIGMAVDANILIYERIREELAHGAALRMAIRNGFGRAMSAIIDSNVTTIISGIALYVFATDQVKGFAVTLILGIITSMFTAIFVARLIFDIAERQGWIKTLSMMRLLTTPNYDFLRWRWVTIGLSTVLVLIGCVAAFDRGKGLFDIDFRGGSSVTFTLRSDSRMPIADVQDALMQTPLADRNLVVVERQGAEGEDRDTRFSLDTSEQSVETVKEIIEKTFAGKLLTYHVEVGEVVPFTEGDFSGSRATLTINAGAGYDEDSGISHGALVAEINNAIQEAGISGVEVSVSHPDYQSGSVTRLNTWDVQLGGMEPEAAQNLLSELQAEMNSTAMFPLASQIGGRVSESMQAQAILAMLVSLLGVILYLWFRFQKVTYGLAASAALVHDVLVTVAMIAISSYIVDFAPRIASILQIDSFQIGLTIVAALLTIIGYSLNDTIVTFDRLREIKGKSPRLTANMVNKAVNQCLSRTILTALTVFIVVVILFFFGGDGIHGFAFAFLVGTIAGTYSTVYIAAPVLLWLSGESAETSVTETAPAVGRAG